MRNILLSGLLSLALVACGGSDESFGGGPTPTPGGPTQPVGTVTVITASPQIDLGASGSVEISAFVRNASNQLMEGVAVNFAANNNGSLLVTQATTDASGLAKATLSTPGDPTTRTITVTATAGTSSDTVDVAVGGVQLTVEGPPSLTPGQVGRYTVALRAGSTPIGSRTITLTSARNYTLSSASVITNSEGQAEFQLTAGSAGDDTITAAALGLSRALPVRVNSDSFTFIDPSQAVPVVVPEVLLTGAPTPSGSRVVRIRWLVAGTPVSGGTVSFATTRGTVSPATATTNAQGEAQTTVTASNAGIAVVTATTVPGGSTAEARLEFVAQTPFSIEVQPSVFTIGPRESSTITAVVRDQPGNLVKNQTVTFTIQDVSGGTLSVGTAVTDSDGRARTVYTAGSTTSANEGVLITAQVNGVAPRTVALTVARREVFISLGTGNEITEPNTAQYMKEFVVQITDSNGNGVAGVPLTLRALSNIYYTGFWYRPTPATTPPWVRMSSLVTGMLTATLPSRRRHDSSTPPSSGSALSNFPVSVAPKPRRARRRCSS